MALLVKIASADARINKFCPDEGFVILSNKVRNTAPSQSFFVSSI